MKSKASGLRCLNKFDEYLNDVEKVIHRQEKDAPYILSRKFLNKRKSEFVKTLDDIEPKWRQKVHIQKELELNKLKQLGDKLRQNNIKKEEDLMMKKEIDDEIRFTKRDIGMSYSRGYPRSFVTTHTHFH